MNALQRDMLRILHTLHAIDPKYAANFAQDVWFFGSAIDLLRWKLDESRMEKPSLKLREEALTARVAQEGIAAACRAVRLAAAKLGVDPEGDAKPPAPKAAEPPKEPPPAPKATAMEYRKVIDALFADEDEPKPLRRRPAHPSAEQLELGAAAQLPRLPAARKTEDP